MCTSCWQGSPVVLQQASLRHPTPLLGLQTVSAPCRWWWMATRRRPSSTPCGAGCVSMWKATLRSVLSIMADCAVYQSAACDLNSSIAWLAAPAALKATPTLEFSHQKQLDSIGQGAHQDTVRLTLQDFSGSCAVNCKDTPAPLKMALSIWWENSFNGACLPPVQV
jgi:hypothetical protein